MIKICFSAFVIAVVFLIGVVFKKIGKNPTPISRSIQKVLIPASFSLLSHICTTFAPTPFFASVFFTVYFISVSWLAVFLTEFCQRFTQVKRFSTLFYKFIYYFTVLVTVLFIFNIHNNIIFSINPVIFASYGFFVIKPTSLFYVHMAIGLSFYIYCVTIVLIKTVKSVSFLRARYYSVLLMLFLMLSSAVLKGGADLPIDFSVFLYCIVVPVCYYITFILVPRRIVRKSLGFVVDTLKSGIVFCDDDWKCLYVNSHFSDFFNCTAENALSIEPVSNFLEFKKSIAVEKNDTFIEEFDYEKNGVHYSLKLSDYVIKENEYIIGRYILIEDISDEKRQILEQKRLRTLDPLTNVYNKEYFFEKVEHRLKYDRFTPYYLIVTDLVNFKLINDLYGKHAGDDILIRIADSFRKYCSSDDLYGRLYNDHFVMLVPRRHFHEEAWLGAFQMNMSYMNNISYTVIGHMGLYAIDDVTTPVSVMCDRAFLAIKTIKNDYKNCFAYYDDNLRNEVIQMQMLMNELPKALEYGEVEMYLQPQFTKELRVVGAEALVRWRHPERGVIPPGDFIEIIEKINIISDVDKYVWECACKKLAEWHKQGRDDLYISVNISPKDFYTLDLYEVLTSLVEKYQIPPSRLNLEITETAVIMDLNNQGKLLDRLRDYGFLVEMDDFGSGYTSLNMLKDICVDVLKIDMGFLQKSQNDEKSRLILEKIIILAKALGMKVVTEGVETVSQIDFLSEVGCDLFQGFYFSRPIPVPDFEERYFK